MVINIYLPVKSHFTLSNWVLQKLNLKIQPFYRMEWHLPRWVWGGIFWYGTEITGG